MTRGNERSRMRTGTTQVGLGLNFSGGRRHVYFALHACVSFGRYDFCSRDQAIIQTRWRKTAHDRFLCRFFFVICCIVSNGERMLKRFPRNWTPEDDWVDIFATAHLEMDSSVTFEEMLKVSRR